MSLLDSKQNAPKDEARLEINGELKFLLKQVLDTLLVLNKIDRCSEHFFYIGRQLIYRIWWTLAR